MAAWFSAVPLGRCHLSDVTIAEIRFGIDRVQEAGHRAALSDWLADDVMTSFRGRILPASVDVLVVWRKLSWEGQKAGHTYSPPDALIAATALVHGLVVVTRNTQDFVRTGAQIFDPWTGISAGGR